MKVEEKEFLEWYRWSYRRDKKLPCLKCSDKKIIACSKLRMHSEMVGCVGFKKYLD